MKTRELGRNVPATIRHQPPSILPGAPPIVRRIAAGVKAAIDAGYQPTRLYLVEADRRELARAIPPHNSTVPLPESFGGLELRQSRARRGSAVYCPGSILLSVPKRAPP